jgi:hypothetical protein
VVGGGGGGWWMGGVKLKLKLNSVQLKLELGLTFEPKMKPTQMMLVSSFETPYGIKMFRPCLDY